MNKNEGKRIFHDQHGARGRYVVSGTVLLGLLTFCVFSVTAVSVLVTPPLLSSLDPGASSLNHLPDTAPADTVLTTPLGVTPWQTLFTAPSPKEGVAVPSEVLGFFVNWDDNSLYSLKAHADSLDGLIPEWLHLTSGTGDFALDNPDRTQETREFLDTEHATLPIYPLINNYNPQTDGWDSESLAGVLATPETRQALISHLLDYAVSQRTAGITIDFEAVPDTSQASLVIFMGELSRQFHGQGLRVMQCIPLTDDSFDIAALGRASDQIILMAYDEHVPSEPTAGPIASMGWYATGIAERFRALSPDRYIVALGNYGYVWPQDESEDSSLTFQEAMRKAEMAQSRIGLESISLNPTFSYTDKQQVSHRVWFLDAVSVFNQMVGAQKLGGAGRYALWRLGSEDPAIWSLFQRPRSLDRAAAEKLEELRFTYELSYEGTGEILQLAETPQNGHRDLEYDEATGLIRAETITDFPTPFVLRRWGGSDEKKIALTFDDGPDATYTPEVLAVLKRYDVAATFFVTGLNANLYPEILRDIFRQGSEIGNHTYTHPDITAISRRQFRLELDSTERIIEGILGRKTLLFRPPYAEDTEPANVEEVTPLVLTRDLGYYTVGMHIDPSDWKQPSAQHIADEVLAQAKAGAGNVVLLHDAGGRREETVAALPIIIGRLKAEGYEIVTLSQLMGLTPETVMPPVTAGDRLLSHINGLTVLSMSFFNAFMRAMFGIGIILGIGRFVVLGTLGLGNTMKARFAKKGLERREQSYRPTVSAIIPAHDEERVIVRTVRSILDSDYPLSSIIVIDDGSVDRTVAVLQQSFPNCPNLRIISQTHTGKAAALNRGIRESDADIIVSLDADTLFLPQTIRKIVRHFSDPRIAGVSGNTKVGNRLNLLTRWQALEYVTSQNLDRRAFEVLNCIPVISGAVGGWRRSALVEVGGFSDATLAEDADATWSLLRSGYEIVYEEEAIAFTEAPATVRNFVKQRFRWAYGTFQTAWKHKGAFVLGPPSVGWVAVPNVFIFQILFPLVAPLMDLLLVSSLAWYGWQKWQHPLAFSGFQGVPEVLGYYLLFLALDFFTALIPFLWERHERLSLLLWLPLQRFFYRQLLYYVTFRALWTAAKGTLAHWRKVERKATAEILT
ncbi:MAG: glycosyltransferase [Candidatus Moraniibacteriota bacterium]|nr:MAG: glycosyltransferase [Candidatus Moranbacteria bacterium]